MKSGPRLDGIIRSLDDNTLEFGGMEVARTSHGGTSSTKSLNDTHKLGKALRDMLGRLCQVAVHESVRGQLQVVGFITAGLVLESVRLCQPKGHVCVYTRHSRMQVPTDVQNLKSLLSLLCNIVQMKVCIHLADHCKNTRKLTNEGNYCIIGQCS
jgi:hypothetical protein